MISHSIRAATLATVFAAVMSSAAPSAHAASFDGPWSVVVMTRSGACDQAYRYGVMIARGVVHYAGGEAGAAKVRTGPAPACGARREVERADRSTPSTRRSDSEMTFA